MNLPEQASPQRMPVWYGWQGCSHSVHPNVPPVPSSQSIEHCVRHPSVLDERRSRERVTRTNEEAKRSLVSTQPRCKLHLRLMQVCQNTNSHFNVTTAGLIGLYLDTATNWTTPFPDFPLNFIMDANFPYQYTIMQALLPVKSKEAEAVRRGVGITNTSTVSFCFPSTKHIIASN